MMSRPRFVLDTNLIVSAALKDKSFSRQVFEIALLKGAILVSEETQNELSEVLIRSKFDRFVTQEKRLRFLAGFLQLATPVTVTENVHVCRDPKDDKFLDVAINGLAQCIVTGDNDLLVLHPFRGIDILSPRNFLEMISAQR